MWEMIITAVAATLYVEGCTRLERELGFGRTTQPREYRPGRKAIRGKVYDRWIVIRRGLVFDPACESTSGKPASSLPQEADGGKLVRMKTSVKLDDELSAEVERTVSLIREDTATVLRMAIRAGLPLIAGRFQSPRPEGYFGDAYKRPRKEQIELEDAAGRMKLSPER